MSVCDGTHLSICFLPRLKPFSLSRFQSPVEFGYYTGYLNDAAVRAAIHVGDVPFVDGSTKVEMALLAVSPSFLVEN